MGFPFPNVRCRFCGKESSRPGWIANTHEPECPRNPARRDSKYPASPAAQATSQNTAQTTALPAEQTPPESETPEQEVERMRQRCLEYESAVRSMNKERDTIQAELDRTRRELLGRKGCVLCNTDLLPDAVREAIAKEVVKNVSAKQDVMQQLLSNVILPTARKSDA